MKLHNRRYSSNCYGQKLSVGQVGYILHDVSQNSSSSLKPDPFVTKRLLQ